MSKEKGNQSTNVIPLIRDKTTRTIIKGQFDSPPGQVREDKIKESLDKINKTMAELTQMAKRQSDLMAYGERPEQSFKQVEGDVPPITDDKEQASTLPRTEELEREYRRKQDEAKKRREQNNRTITRSYNLIRRGKEPPRK